MKTNKLFFTAIVILAAAMIISSLLIANSLNQIGNLISNGVQNGNNNVSSSISNFSSAVGKAELSQDIMTLEETADYLRLQDFEMQKLVEMSGIPYLKIYGKYVFSKSAVNRWMEEKVVRVE